MKKRRITSVALSALMLISLTACGGQTVEQTTATSATTEDDDIVNPVDVEGVELAAAQDVDISGTVLRYMGCYDVTKAGDIKPIVKYLQEKYDCTIEVEIRGIQRYTALRFFSARKRICVRHRRRH